mgnify:CR=1 FL=1
MVLEKIAVLKELTIFSVLLRTVLAMVFSGILGYEREKKGRPAGFRTYMVVCIGSEIAMMTGIFLSRELGSTDPSRIVKGLTTAAGLWADACLGLALGSGFYSGAIVGFAAIWCSLKILSTVDKRLGKTARVFGVYVEFVSIKDLSAFLAYGRGHGCKMDGLEIVRSKDVDGNRVVGATMTLHFDTPVSHEKVIEEFGRLDGVQFIKEI